MENSLILYDGEDKVVSSFELSERYKNEPIKESYNTGLMVLDTLIGGLDDGMLVALSGYTKSGKTSMSQTLTYNFSRAGIGCLWFTFEMGAKEFLKKFPNGIVPLFYMPEVLKETTLTWIEEKIKESSVKYGSKIIFIDHLHFLVPMSSTGNMSFLIGAVMRELKKMAIRNNIIIFILAHTVKVKTDETPGLEHIRDSSFIAQESDLVLMISRKHFDENDPTCNFDKSARIRVLANRKTGNRGVVNMTYEDHFYKEVTE